MTIAVHCRCGKKFKVKDHLAGRKVRCPACRGPLRVPGEKVASPAKEPAAASARREDKRDPVVTQEEAEKALLKFEEVNKNKQRGAEAEAAYQAEHNRLIEAYDQLAGKSAKDKKKKTDIAPGKPRKAGFFTKLADFIGMVCGTWYFKWALYSVVMAGGMVGSYYAVKFAWGYTHSVAADYGKSKEQQMEELFRKANAAIEAKKWGEADAALAELRQLVPNIEKRNTYRVLKEKLDKGVAKS